MIYISRKYFKYLLTTIILIIIYIGYHHGWIHIGSSPQADQDISHISIIDDSKIPNYAQDSSIRQVSGSLYTSPVDLRKGRTHHIYELGGSIYVWIYDITMSDTLDMLYKLTQRESIYMIMEDKTEGNISKPSRDKLITIQKLAKHNIQVQNDDHLDTRFVHAKVFLGSSGAMIQTHNLTYSSFHKNREFMLYTQDRDIISSLRYIYQSDRNHKNIDTSYIHPNLLICPIDCRAKIYDLLKSAKSSIYIYNQYLKDPGLQDLLQDISKNPTIKVQMIMAQNDDNKQLYDIFGDEIKLLAQPYPHAKMILIDDHYLMISSINMSTNSMDNNREIGITITNKDAIDKFKKIFVQDRSKAK